MGTQHVKGVVSRCEVDGVEFNFFAEFVENGVIPPRRANPRDKSTWWRQALGYSFLCLRHGIFVLDNFKVIFEMG